MDELNLTPRERQVAELFVLGLPIIAIGKRLAMAPGTVKVHISRARFKNRECPLFRDRRGWSVNEPLNKFFRWVMEANFKGEDIDGSELQGKALELGLAHLEPYDPERHGEKSLRIEAGEPWCVLDI